MTSNRKTVLTLTGIGLSMLALGFASKPIYDTFCRITGYGGTPGIAQDNLSEVLNRKVKVSFDANVNELPWDFAPEQRSMDVQIGPPIKAAPFFIKTECFCFTEQRIEPGQEISMPVLYFVDPQLDEDKRLDDVREITLSYTFFEVENPSNPQAISSVIPKNSRLAPDALP